MNSNKKRPIEIHNERLVKEFLNVLQDDKLDWVKMWHDVAADTPYNAETNRKYKGTNRFLLSLVAYIEGYTDPRWMTMNQANKHGYSINPGEHAVPVVYYKPWDLINKAYLSWEEYEDEIKSGRDVHDFSLRCFYSNVWNACQMTGLPEIKVETFEGTKASEVLDVMSTNMDIEILNDGGNRAYYSPTEDKIHLPRIEVFKTSSAYNATALHELAHSTGHKSRLDRKLSTFFGSDSYAFEELVAEMSSAFVCAYLKDVEYDETHINNHKAYIQNWVQPLKDDPSILNKAVGVAEGVCDYMLLKGEIINEKEYQNRNTERKMVKAQAQLEKIAETQNTGFGMSM